MYKSIDLKETAAKLEKRIRDFWDENSTHEKSINLKNGAPKFVFFEGPPTANGKPGIHHVLARTIKDSVCRYKTMKGYQVNRKAGWDTHGLPVEIEVGKKLNLLNKQAVEDYGMEKFCTACKESVFSYESLWKEMTKTMGYWLDMENPYITLDNNYIESVWWLLKQMFDKGLIYKGHKIVPYSPSSGTPLSSHEVAQGYKETVDPSVYAKFKVKGSDDTYFLAWTTTPWTLISNVALVVNPEETYVKAKVGDEYLILAKALLRVIDGEYEVVDEFVGKSLEYKEYEQLFPFVVPEEKAFYIALGDYVSMSDGTGVVHTAPAFGQDDYELGKKYDLPMIQPVDLNGKFTAQITDWAGQFVKDADKGIIRNLKERGLLYKREQIKHNYPFDWRTGEPLIYYARSSWYIKTSEYKQQLIDNNNQINWHPGFVGEKRFGEWLNNNVDWALSRDRFWGTPLNIWIDEETNDLVSIGSIVELQELGTMADGSKVPDDIELHRPYIDNVIIKNPKNGNIMKRTPEVIDCWFDSGAMPFAQWHYPFENKENFDELFPADFISEGIDQTRGWFYTLLAISTIITGKAPYKNVLVNDLILDKKGIKMSKSKGNSVDPMLMMDKYGADAVRWYLLSVSPPWVPTRFDEKGVAEVMGKVFGTLKNVYSFYVTYANIDNFQAGAYTGSLNLENEIDKWIVSKLNEVIKQVAEFNESYDFTRTLRLLGSFIVDDVSNWYVRRSRRRFWAMELTEDKVDAYRTLHAVLINVAKLIAPFAPYISEDIYKNLTGLESVHLADYPTVEENLIDEKLNLEMETIINTVSLGRAARNSCQIKVRQPLAALYVPSALKPLVNRMESLIKEEINVKEIRYISAEDDLIQYQIKPNFKTMGPKYGKLMKQIAGALNKAKAHDIIMALNNQGSFELDINDEAIILTKEDLSVSILDRPGFTFESMKDLFVALDTELTDELVIEGFARELINKIQNTRKDSGFEVMDNIVLEYSAEEVIDLAFEKHGSYICSETLMNSFKKVEKTDDMQEWDINENTVYYSIKKA